MSEEKVVIRFSAPHSLPGGPGYNAGEQAAFSREVAEEIVNLNRGAIIRIVPAPIKAFDNPPQDKMIVEPDKKKSRRRFGEVGQHG